jgi:hypothetical protein
MGEPYVVERVLLHHRLVRSWSSPYGYDEWILSHLTILLRDAAAMSLSILDFEILPLAVTDCLVQFKIQMFEKLLHHLAQFFASQISKLERFNLLNFVLHHRSL